MRRKRDYRSIVIIGELSVLAVLAVALYVQQYPFSATNTTQPQTSTTTSPATSTVSVPAVATSTVPLGKGGDVPTTTVSLNEWLGTTTETGLHPYIEVVDGCGPHYEGTCLNARSGPGTDYSVASQLRNGTVLPVARRVERDGEIWYQVDFKSYDYVLYPERITSDWYINDRYVKLLYNIGELATWKDKASTTDKRIVVDRGKQTLYAYDGETLYMEVPVSTGLALTPTPLGSFKIFMKTPSSYMQGPSPTVALKQFYDLPGVPWDLYFTKGGAVIHGAFWHNDFGHPYSHGCVNLSPSDSYKLYQWAVLGTKVDVID